MFNQSGILKPIQVACQPSTGDDFVEQMRFLSSQRRMTCERPYWAEMGGEEHEQKQAKTNFIRVPVEKSQENSPQKGSTHAIDLLQPKNAWKETRGQFSQRQTNRNRLEGTLDLIYIHVFPTPFGR